MRDRRPEELRSDLESLRIERTPAGRVRAVRWRRPASIALACGAVALGGAWFWSMRPVRVHVARAEALADGGQVVTLVGSGYVVSGERYVSIGVRVPGRIDRYFVEEGQRVGRGDPLVQLDDRDYQAAERQALAELEIARADLALASAELERGRTLRRDGVVSRQELDVLRNRAAVARATLARREALLEQARVNLEYTLLRAPTDGIVLAKLKEVGEIAVPGGFAGSGDLVRLANMADLRAELDVNEADLARVRMGQRAEVVPDAYGDVAYPAEVVKLYPQVDRQKGTLKVEVRVLEPDERLLPDMSVRVRFLASDESGRSSPAAVGVPARAVQSDDEGRPFVWRLVDGRARRHPVETSGSVGERVRVRGLEAGAVVAIGPLPTRDGQRVQALPEAR